MLLLGGHGQRIVLGPPTSYLLTSTGRQAADLHGVWLDSLALPEGIGDVPAHHLPLLDALSTGGRALYRSRKARRHSARGGWVGEREEGAVNSATESTKKVALPSLDQMGARKACGLTRTLPPSGSPEPG